MGTLKNLISLCFRLAVRLAVYALIFIGLSWLLLGLTPTVTVQTSLRNLSNLMNVTRDISRTAGDMGAVARHHLNQASERIDGKDPYEDFNATLDERTREGGLYNK